MARESAEDPSAAPVASGDGPDAVGTKIRAERMRQGMGVRELSRRVDVSASMISQVELGRATPSVGTLYAIVSELGMSLDGLFSDQTAAPAPAAPGRPLRDGRDHTPQVTNGDHTARSGDAVVHGDERRAIQLASGVRWERLTAATEQDLDFLYVVYDAGGASCAEDSLMRHAGREYGYIIRGTLNVTIGFDTHVLGPGDSISFDSTVPHRLCNDGDEPAEGIWFVVGRSGDARVADAADGTFD
jgi:mannose-6-phosphate isomerase-like protein (cupin superfamily)/DNA-binding XRE family transcriptional regulator